MAGMDQGYATHIELSKGRVLSIHSCRDDQVIRLGEWSCFSIISGSDRTYHTPSICVWFLIIQNVYIVCLFLFNFTFYTLNVRT